MLAAALPFVNGSDVVLASGDMVDDHHLRFDRHQIIFAEGVASESNHPGHLGILGLDAPVRQELFDLFPELRGDPARYGPAGLRCLRATEARAALSV